MTCSVGPDVYRDDPLDDEAELRDVVGDEPIDRLLEAGGAEAVAAASDALRILQGWVDPEQCATWLTTPLRRLDGHDPLAALALGHGEDVHDALRAYLAAQG